MTSLTSSSICSSALARTTLASTLLCAIDLCELDISDKSCDEQKATALSVSLTQRPTLACLVICDLKESGSVAWSAQWHFNDDNNYSIGYADDKEGRSRRQTGWRYWNDGEVAFYGAVYVDDIHHDFVACNADSDADADDGVESSGNVGKVLRRSLTNNNARHKDDESQHDFRAWHDDSHADCHEDDDDDLFLGGRTNAKGALWNGNGRRAHGDAGNGHVSNTHVNTYTIHCRYYAAPVHLCKDLYGHRLAWDGAYGRWPWHHVTQECVGRRWRQHERRRMATSVVSRSLTTLDEHSSLLSGLGLVFITSVIFCL